MLKGVLLCGGEGTRLRPLTEVVNKHLVRVIDRPMAEYPLLRMIEAGIDDILIVTGGENFAGVCKYFGSGSKWKIRINYAVQDRAGGIAEALGLARTFAGKDKIMVCLGDNIWSMNLSTVLGCKFPDCLLFSIQSKTPERFGVLEFDRNGSAIDVIEKPQEFISDRILAGIYIYGPGVFDIIKDLKPSGRGELEISDVNRYYVIRGDARIIEMDGWWTDCGSIDTLLQAEELIKNADRSLSSFCA